jgi:hypothetical protein
MTTNYHTPIAVGAAANAATFNTPLGTLDSALTTLDTAVDAIDSTVDNAMTGVYNVLEYGAVGDGVTDDTTAVQAAITATPYGCITYFPFGVYNISNTLTVGNNITLQGSGSGSNNAGTEIKYTGVADPIIYCAVDDVKIRDLYIRAKNGLTAISLVGVSGFTVSNIIMTSSDAGEFCAISAVTCFASTIQNVITNRGYIDLNTGCTSITLRDCFLDYTTGIAYRINTCYYIGLINCATDHGSSWGYDITSGSQGISMVACGAEACAMGHTAIEGNGVGMYNCLGYGNGAGLTGAYETSGVYISGDSACVIGFVDMSPSDASGQRNCNIQIVAGAARAVIVCGELDKGVDDAGTNTLLFSGSLGIGNSATAGTNEVQTITIDATGGTWTCTYSGQTTAALAYNITAAALQTALEGLSSIVAGHVTVTGGPGATAGLVCTFVGALGSTDLAAMTTNAGSLTGGAGTATVVETTPGVAAVLTGPLIKKMQIFDGSGNSLGYIPIYDVIT